jgi:hypothetical protein
MLHISTLESVVSYLHRAVGSAVVSLQLTRSGAVGSMLLASRDAGCLILTAILLLITPSLGLQRLAVQHISQHAYGGRPPVGVPFDIVYDGMHPAASWGPQPRGFSDPYLPNEAYYMPFGVQQSPLQPRQYSNARQQVPTDKRPEPDRGNKYMQQPSSRARHSPNTRQYTPSTYRPPHYKGYVDPFEQPNDQPWNHFNQHPFSAFELQGHLGIDTADMSMGVDFRKWERPQHMPEPEPDVLRGAHDKGPGMKAKWQVSHPGCRLLVSVTHDTIVH